MILSAVRLAACLLALSILASVAVAADQLEYGTYACITQRLVGHQTSEQDKVRHSGSFRPRNDRFLVTIEKIERNALICDPTKSDTALSKPRTYHWWWECEASNQAVMSEGKATGHRFHGDHMNVFLDDNGGNSFRLTVDGTYRLVFDNFEGDHYLEEGVCQRMK
jgi:hypothetical protein